MVAGSMHLVGDRQFTAARIARLRDFHPATLPRLLPAPAEQDPVRPGPGPPFFPTEVGDTAGHPDRVMAAIRRRSIIGRGWSRHTREDRTMEASELDVLGPVDYLVVEFPADKANFSGEMAAELRALVDREVVRVLDLVLLRKEPDGSVEVAELADVDERDVGELARSKPIWRCCWPRRTSTRSARPSNPAASRPSCVREQLGGTVRLLDPPVGRPARGQRTHPDPGTAGRDRSGRTKRIARSLKCHWAQDAEVARACSADRSRERRRSSEPQPSSSTVTTGATTGATTAATTAKIDETTAAPESSGRHPPAAVGDADHSG